MTSSSSSTTSIPTDAADARTAPHANILPNVGIPTSSSSSTAKTTRTTTSTIASASVTVLPLPSPIKGKADWRQYRCVQIVGTSNNGGVTVCAVHDPQSKTSAAAATVHAGAAMDPRDMPGLAHFCEHMCFLGSAKYPGENEYKRFLAQHGGSSNASTSLHLTTYKFEVTAAHFEHALDVFSSFFVQPLFTSSGTSREVHAVDSENSKNLIADARRRLQILKDIGDPNHYYTKFTTGNAQTLPTNDPDSLERVRQHLLAFHRLHYRPENLTVVVAGPQSLDQLLEWVIPRFGAMPSASEFPSPEHCSPAEQAVWQAAQDAPPYHYTAPPQPFRSPFRPNAITELNNNSNDNQQSTLSAIPWPAVLTVKPVRSMRQLGLMFPLPPMLATPDRSPSALLSHLLGHEGPGSPFAVLQNAGWISALSAGPRAAAPDFTLFQISVTLTESGEGRWKHVADVLFQHCRLLARACETDSPEELHCLWGEKADLAQVMFQQSSPGTVYSLAPSLSNSIVLHGTEQSLAAGSMLSESASTLPLTEVAEVLKLMVPSNCLLERCGEVAWEEMERATAESLVQKRQEPWYGIDYYYSAVDPDDAERWAGIRAPFLESASAYLQLPSPNQYIPRTLELCPDLPVEARNGPQIDKEITPPQLLVDTPTGRLWHRLDDRYALPKSAVTLLYRTPAVVHEFSSGDQQQQQWQQSTRAVVNSALLSGMFAEAMAQETYDAELAGLQWGLQLTTTGVQIGASGFSDRLSDLTLRVLDEFWRRSDNQFWQESYFVSSKDRLLRNLRTFFSSRRADAHSIYYRDFLLASAGEGIDASIAAAEAATMDSVREYHHRLLGMTAMATTNSSSGIVPVVDCLYTGNVSEREARDFFEAAMSKIEAARVGGSDGLDSAATIGPELDDKTQAWIPSSQERRLLPGHSVELHFASKNEQEENGSVVITYQSPMPGFRGEGLSSEESLRSSSAMRLLCHILREPLFDELRTKQTLGYIVSSYFDVGWSAAPSSEVGSTPWAVPVESVVISVLSRKVAPPEVVRRIDTFLDQFRRSLTQMPESEIADHAAALSTKLLKPIQKLSTESSTHFGKIRHMAPEILSLSPSSPAAMPWDNTKVVAGKIRSLSREDLLQAWDLLRSSGGRVVSCVYGTTFPLPHSSSIFTTTSKHRTTVIVDALADLGLLRQKLPVYDLTPSVPQASKRGWLSVARPSPLATVALVGAGAVVLAAGWTFLGRSKKHSSK